MNRKEAISGHKARLRRLTDIQARNLMEHAANKTPLLAVDIFSWDFVQDGKS